MSKENPPKTGTVIDKTKTADGVAYPSGLRLALVLLSVFIGMFLVSLDRLIITTAVPRITNEFHSVDDIGWYGTAYLLTSCTFQLLFGKIYTVFSIKPVFMASVLLFEAGSALCGAAPNSIAFIIGRAIAGLGSGGVMGGVMVIVVFSLPMHKRPKFQGLFGAVFGVASVAGPLVGGAFTTYVSWRWCFYINLPLGGVVLTIVFFLLRLPLRPTDQKPLKQKIWELNGLGMLAIIPGVICLCLALQWGGIKYSWKNGRIIALFVLAVVLFIAFILIQVWKPEQATLPPSIFLQRSIISGFWVSVCLGAHMTLFIYYLPLWFQIINDISAQASGIHLLPMILPLVGASILVGQLISRIGYYTPFLYLGLCLSVAGAALISTILSFSSSPRRQTWTWVIPQLIYGAGLGSCNQTPNIAAQTVLPRNDVVIGASLMFFGQQLSAAVFAAIGLTAFSGQLAQGFTSIGRPIEDSGSDSAHLVHNGGATQLLAHLKTDEKDDRLVKAVLHVYGCALQWCFRVGLIMACVGIVGGLFMEWRHVKGKGKGKRGVIEEGGGDSSVRKGTEAGCISSEEKGGLVRGNGPPAGE